jgi:hypothetical protein
VYEPPELFTIGTVESLTLDDDDDDDHGFDGRNYAKRWGRRGDYWHWYRKHDDDKHRHHSR